MNHFACFTKPNVTSQPKIYEKNHKLETLSFFIFLHDLNCFDLKKKDQCIYKKLNRCKVYIVLVGANSIKYKEGTTFQCFVFISRQLRLSQTFHLLAKKKKNWNKKRMRRLSQQLFVSGELKPARATCTSTICLRVCSFCLHFVTILFWMFIRLCYWFVHWMWHCVPAKAIILPLIHGFSL